MAVINFIITNHELIINSILGVLSGLTALSLIIPGEQPEKTFNGIAAFLSKFSRK